MKDLLLGIDIGTTGTKCTFYDMAGTMVASAYQEYPMLNPRPGWYEQDPQKWWDSVCKNLRACFSSKRVAKERVLAIGISGTNAVVLVDGNGSALCPALGLHDRRSEEQLAWLRERIDGAEILRITGNRLAKGSFALPRLKWMQEQLPEAMEKSRCFLTPGGYVTQHLTGEFIISHSRANLTLMADIHTGNWSDAIVEAAEFPRSRLPKSVAPCTVVGAVTAAAAAETGLLEGTPVAAENVDTVAATLAAGAVEPGDIAITIGSSGRVCCISGRPMINEKLLNCESPIPGRWTVIQTTDNAGVSLRWFRDVFGKTAAEEVRGGESIYDVFNRMAAAVPPGAEGLLYLPYLSGEQSPIWNPSARGVFFGMGLESGYGHFVRAVMEGVAFSIKDCLGVLELEELPPFIPMGGGAANSGLWCQIFADVLGCPISKAPYAETETLGAAITAVKSVGSPFPRGEAAPDKVPLFMPRREYTERYQESFRKYKSVYNHLICDFGG